MPADDSQPLVELYRYHIGPDIRLPEHAGTREIGPLGISIGMATEVLMPALSPTMTEGKIARWLKEEGERVSAGDVLAEIETDKATMAMEAVDDGVLSKIVIPEGTDHVAVNTPIALIAANGGAAAETAWPLPVAEPVRSAPPPVTKSRPSGPPAAT